MTEPRVIAGHRFVETWRGTRCQDCGRSLVSLFTVRESDIGSEGWAGYGALNRTEYDQIRAEIDRVWRHTAAVASGAGIGGMAAGGEGFEEMEGFR